MMVVTLAPNDKETVLRGTAAREWLAWHRFTGERRVLLILPDGRRERALAAITDDLMLCLVLGCDDLTDFLARLSFDQAFDALMKQGVQRHARS